MRGWGIFLGVCLAVAARADGVEERRVQALKLKNEGAAALERGEVEAALEKFRAAHRAYPSPNLLFNIGLALDRVERGPEALDAYEAFVADPGEAPPEARAHAQERVQFWSAQLGHLAVAASLDGAEIFVDGRGAGVTPLLRALHLSPGVHLVEARKAGSAAREKIAVPAGATVRLSLTLIAEAPPKTPLYRRWWLWTAVAGVVVVGAAVGLGVGLAPPRPNNFSPTLGDDGPR